MQDLRGFVHFPADAVAAVFPHHAIAVPLGVFLNGVANIAESRAGAHLVNAFPHGLVGGFYQFVCDGRYITDQIHFTGVGDKPILFQGDIQIHDIAVFQFARCTGHPVAHHFIDRAIERVGVVVLTLAGGSGVERVDDEVFHLAVDLHGGDARRDEVVEHFKHLAEESTRLPHQRLLLRGFHLHLIHGQGPPGSVLDSAAAFCITGCRSARG